MPWFKVDDNFHGHPKVVELTLEAVGLWTLCGSWCSQYLTDGEINLRNIQRLGGTEAHTAELVASGLWVKADESVFQFKDWAEYQPLKAVIEAERDAARERMAAARSKKKLRPSIASGSEDVRANNTRTFARTSEEVRVTPTHPIPSHPDPPPYGGVTPREPDAGQMGSRIPANFTADAAMIRWAQDNAPNVNLKLSTQKFKAHHRSVAGRAQFKTDWVAAWESWLLSDQQRAESQPQQFKTAGQINLEAGAQRHQRLTAQTQNQQELEA